MIYFWKVKDKKKYFVILFPCCKLSCQIEPKLHSSGVLTIVQTGGDTEKQGFQVFTKPVTVPNRQVMLSAFFRQLLSFWCWHIFVYIAELKFVRPMSRRVCSSMRGHRRVAFICYRPLSNISLTLDKRANGCALCHMELYRKPL